QEKPESRTPRPERSPNSEVRMARFQISTTFLEISYAKTRIFRVEAKLPNEPIARRPVRSFGFKVQSCRKCETKPTRQKPSNEKRCRFYQTNPCDRRAGSKFRIQGSKLSKNAKRTHCWRSKAEPPKSERIPKAEVPLP